MLLYPHYAQRFHHFSALPLRSALQESALTLDQIPWFNQVASATCWDFGPEIPGFPGTQPGLIYPQR